MGCVQDCDSPEDVRIGTGRLAGDGQWLPGGVYVGEDGRVYLYVALILE